MFRLITLLFILLTHTLVWSNSHYFFQDINQNYNLSNIGIITMCEDENGFLWFGGMNGLYYHNTLSVEKVNLSSNKSTAPNNINITKIYKDSHNTIWICTSNGLYKYIRSENIFEHKRLVFPTNTNGVNIRNIVQLNDQEYLLHKNNTILSYNERENRIHPTKACISKSISYLQKDANGIIYIGTSNGKIYVIQDRLEHISLLYDSPKGRISSVCKDGNKYYIGYAQNGVDIINSNGTKINELNSTHLGSKHLKTDHISSIIRRENGEIWMGTDAGIYIFKNDELTLLDSQLETGLPHRSIYAIHQGYNDKVWVSTYAGGLACYSKYNYLFKYILVDYPQKQLDKSHVSTICEDSRAYIWVGNEDEGGIKVYAPEKMDFIQELPAEVQNTTKGIKAITSVSDEVVAWGINASNRITLYNFKRRTIERQIEVPLNENIGVRGMQYLNGALWVYDTHHIVVYHIKTQKIINSFNSIARIWQLYIDSSQNIWACTIRGLYIIKPGMNTLEHCIFDSPANALGESSIYSVCEDMNGIIWVGTMGQGLYQYNPVNKSLTPAPDHHLAAESDIYNLLKDKQSNIWYMTNKGLYRFDSKNNKTDYYGTNNGTINAQNRLNASLVCSTGKLYIGAKSGFTIIDPSLIKKNKTIPSVFLSNFKVNNTPFARDSNSFQNTLGLTQLQNVTLKASENTLALKVVSNNYIKAERNRFKYRLKNYDDNWIEVAHNREIVFTKVPPGNYIFEVYGSNNDHLWSKKPYRLTINIQRPLYGRWYAIGLYILILTSIGWLIYKELMSKIKLRKEIAEERYKTKANKQIYSERVKLFTNISHELRTPLSLIVSPIKHMLQKSTIDNDTKHLLNVVDRNAKRLQKIADQTIDFRLLEIGKLKPTFESHEIIQLTKDVFLCFEQHFIDQQINFSFTSDFKHIRIVVDGDMIEKIIYNLLSNAVKYTPEKGTITLNICQREMTNKEYKTSFFTGHRFEGQAISITVTDTGSGIKEELLPHIFERFTKGELAHQNSTGIGLHLCQEYAKMNKGNMQLATKDEKGSCFILNLPFEKSTYFERSELKQLVKFELTEGENAQIVQSNDKLNVSSILIVEDNVELRDFLKISLGAHFRILTAKNGEQAISQLKDLSPDLILTDVSMPGISGVELTKQLKQNKEHSDIPIIVMTAHADRNYQMESILNGADAFFTKPIDEAMLLAQINNILNNKKINASAQSHQVIVSEKSFVEKAEIIVENNLQNPNFQIADLLKELHISKTTLTRKLKSEMQQNASGFIRDVRLKNARTLLANKQFNIDEISTFVGFNYTSYFIKSFKDKYGITPSEYRKRMA